MESLINILHLEDEPADMALVRAELAEAGLDFHLTQAQTRDEFETALRNEGTDIILADVRLPMYDGMSALRLARELRPDIPFIFVSGAMGEEAAIEALIQGATDYVLKQNLARLPSAVQRALEEAHNRRDRKQAEEQVFLMSFAMNSIHEAAFITDEEACFQYVNKEACRLLGYPRDELLSMRIPDISPGLSMQHWPDHWNDLKQNGTLTFEREFRTKDGRMFPVEISASYFEYEGKSYDLGLVRDITERKQTERERLANLKFFESMDRVNRAIQAGDDLEKMLKDVLDIVLSIFDCDRAFLMHPCDPEASSWQVPMERHKPEYAGVRDLKREMPMDPQVAETLRILLNADGPVKFGPGHGHPLPTDLSERFQLKSLMSMALFPRVGKPWQFGIQQCSHAHVWTEEDERLLQEIGRRLEDGLTSMLAYRHLRESETRYRQIVDTANEGVCLSGSDGIISFVNARMAEMLGCSEMEMIGQSIADFMFEEDVSDHVRRMEKRRQGVHEFYERRFRHKDGRTVWTHISATPIFDVEHCYNGAFGMFTDITKNKEAEIRLSEQLNFLQQLLDSIPIPVFYKDREGLYLGCNVAFEAHTDLPREDIVGKTVHEVAPEDFVDKHHEMDLALFSQPGVQTYEVKGVYKNGKSHDVIFHKATFVDANGDVAGTVGALMDVTELKQAERERLANLRFFESMDKVNQAIQKADSLEQMMKDVLDIVLSILDCDRVYLMHPCDPAAATWTVPMERSKPGYAGAIYTQKLAIPMEPTLAEMLQIVIDTDGPVTFGPGADHPLSKNAKEKYGIKSTLTMALFPRVGKPWVFGVHRCSHAGTWTAEEKTLVREIGRRLEDALSSLLAYRDLQESEERYRLIAENTADTISVFNLNLKPIYASPSIQKLRGYTAQEAMTQSLDQVLTPESLQKVEKIFVEQLALEEGGKADPARTVIIELEQYRKNGSTIWVEMAASALRDDDLQIIGILTVSRDITERKKLEEQLRQSQKMEAVGQLAGGVAHDFNNMLGVIIGGAQMAMEVAAQPNSLRKHLEAILTASYRSAEITRQLLAFARKQAIVPKILDLNETVEGMLKLLRRLIGEDIDLVWLPGTKLWSVKMDPSQVDQIMANLCVNARDAIAGAGKVTIETHNVVLDDAYCAAHKGFSLGEYVMLAVSDNGGGMDKQTMDKIFEPFFTTKELGKGTGLGLSTVYGIVKQNTGYINVYSEPEHGSTFKIYLPRHAVETEQIEKESLKAPRARGHETVLVVEDESVFLDVVQLMLKSLGYTVLTAATPGEAIGIASDKPDELNLLIADVIMPEMNGQELEKKLTALYPQLRCLFMSGYSGNVIADHGILDERIDFIQKPFSIQELAVKVREVLDRN